MLNGGGDVSSTRYREVLRRKPTPVHGLLSLFRMVWITGSDLFFA